MIHPAGPETAAGSPVPAFRGQGMTWRVGALLATVVACLVVAFSGPRLAQSIEYFDFADGRSFAGIPNAQNVLSNVAFLIAGLAGFAALRFGRARFRDPRERAPWAVLFLGVFLTGLGSAWFHLQPSSSSLVWDRLPMTIGFMGLLSALLTERVDATWGRRLLWPLVAIGLGSVLYWYATETAGAGDLRPYFFVQFFPLLVIPLLLVIFPARYSETYLLLVALGLYLLAKVAEAEDATIFQLGSIVSGHTVKHLLAAAGIGVLAWMLGRRRPVEPRGG
jgi:hypothetical protein